MLLCFVPFLTYPLATNSQKHCLTTVNLIALLSSGASPSDTRNHVDIVVHQGGIEACVSAMRAHQTGLAVARAVNNALTKIAAAPKGATAVATRGASRQLMRALALFSAVRVNHVEVCVFV
jgi:hypothetical protein